MSRIRLSGGAIGALGLALLAPAATAAPVPEHLDLQQALQLAFARSAVLESHRVAVDRAEAQLVTAGAFPFDPTLAVEAARRSSGSDTTDHEVRVGQEIEIGGQLRHRVAAATASAAGARSALLRERHLLAARVRVAFIEALRARELSSVEAANTELARSLAEVARKRFEAGAAAQMEVNLAEVQVGRAERDRTLAGGSYEVARATLAELIGADPVRPPEIAGELSLPATPLPLVEPLIEEAANRRADLQALRHEAEAARARIELARRQGWPGVTLEAFYGREEGTERLLGGGVQLRIPLFNRSRGPIAEARAAERQIVAETASADLRVRREIAAALARYRTATRAATELQHRVLGTLQENLALLQRSFEAGKTGWTEVLVFRREFVDVQRDSIEAVADARLAKVELDLAAGFADPGMGGER